MRFEPCHPECGPITAREQGHHRHDHGMGGFPCWHPDEPRRCRADELVEGDYVDLERTLAPWLVDNEDGVLVLADDLANIDYDIVRYELGEVGDVMSDGGGRQIVVDFTGVGIMWAFRPDDLVTVERPAQGPPVPPDLLGEFR